MQHDHRAFGTANPPGLDPKDYHETLHARVYTPRFGQVDDYSLTRTDKGWVTHRRGSASNQAGKDGSPAWYGELHADHILWTSVTPSFLEQLWKDLDDKAIAPAQAQEALTRYCEALSTLNRTFPSTFRNPPRDWDEDDWNELAAGFPESPPTH